MLLYHIWRYSIYILHIYYTVSPVFHRDLLVLPVENMPAVKMTVFTFCDQFKVFFEIVKPVVVDVVDFHPGRSLSDQAVHSDQVVFAGNTFTESCITVIC